VPQLVKGGKHAFGWSRVGLGGRIAVPPEARIEYRLQESERLLVVPGSRTSGGFGLVSRGTDRSIVLAGLAESQPSLTAFRVPEGEVVTHKRRPYCWVELRGGCATLPPATLERYGIRVGDRLLVIRGSGLAVGFVVRGPIVQEAGRHPELELFEA
jgi:bifunctional DNA-binding transcriptional regulator/antitoxin component of YhaV-PrlF toxin-antitoxin module